LSPRSRRLLLLWIPAATAAGLAAVWLLWPRTAITRENAEKVQLGMTLAEVEAILGGPARDQAGGSLVADSTPEEALGEFAQLFANPGATWTRSAAPSVRATSPRG
jgi:hypothetical protein